MAARSARLFSELLKCSSRRTGILGRTTKKFPPLSQYRFSSSILKVNKPVVKRDVNSNTFIIPARSFAADTSNEPSIEVQTMDVLKLFDKVDPSKVFRII